MVGKESHWLGKMSSWKKTRKACREGEGSRKRMMSRLCKGKEILRYGGPGISAAMHGRRAEGTTTGCLAFFAMVIAILWGFAATVEASNHMERH
jgi:hypothetical protein